MTEAEMLDLLLSIRNRCDALLVLRGTVMLPIIQCTLIEDIYEDAQAVVEMCKVCEETHQITQN